MIDRAGGRCGSARGACRCTHLGVGKVVALIVVQGETQAALILAQVVAHEVGVLREVDGFQRQPAQPLPPVDGLQSQCSTK